MGCSVQGRNGNAFSFSHLLFAYDTLVFYKDKEEQLVYLSWILYYFKALSELKYKGYAFPSGRGKGY